MPRSNKPQDEQYDELLLGADLTDAKLLHGNPRWKGGNPDPITGEPGSHPVGTGVGAAGGGLGGAVIGTVGGAIGAIGGALAGRGVAERIDPTVEDQYWRDSYRTRPYVGANETYETYQPAYRYGWESRQKYQGKTWEQAEPELSHYWSRARGPSSLHWDRARLAAKDAWHRVEEALPGDADEEEDPIAGARTIGSSEGGIVGGVITASEEFEAKQHQMEEVEALAASLAALRESQVEVARLLGITLPSQRSRNGDQ